MFGLVKKVKEKKKIGVENKMIFRLSDRRQNERGKKWIIRKIVYLGHLPLSPSIKQQNFIFFPCLFNMF